MKIMNRFKVFLNFRSVSALHDITHIVGVEPYVTDEILSIFRIFVDPNS